MITRPLFMKLLDAASMQRWNDKIRPVELRELDKQAHKMMIAYFLAKFDEKSEGFSWLSLIEGGLFELLERLVLTDLKPQVFDRIKEDREKYARLREWVFERLRVVLFPLGESFLERFHQYFLEEGGINRHILGAAHLLATQWEFNIIERANPFGYEIPEIKEALQERQERFFDLKGIHELSLYRRYRNFVDLCGQLRFQVRWGHINMVPRVSVLGHMLIVAVFSYLFSLSIGASPRRCVNNYFTGLFHDLPEVLTRDIISPVKKSVEGLEEIIKGYEKEQMEKEVLSLMPQDWREEIRLYTQDEFESLVFIDNVLNKVSSEEISSRFNEDRFNPRDGELVKAIDELAAFAEATTAIGNGVKSRDLEEAVFALRAKYRKKSVVGIPFGSIFEEF